MGGKKIKLHIIVKAKGQENATPRTYRTTIDYDHTFRKYINDPIVCFFCLKKNVPTTYT